MIDDIVYTEVKDSGQRQEFSTGAKRDTQGGKGRFDLLPGHALTRLARHFENGAVKYGDDNWRKGMPLNRYFDSAFRHLVKFMEGERDEDHATAVVWNMMCLIETEYMIKNGTLPTDLDTLRKGPDGRRSAVALLIPPNVLQKVSTEYNKTEKQSKVLLMCNKIVCLMKSLFSKSKRKVPQYC